MASDASSATSSGEPTGLRVVVCDDDAIVRSVVTQLIEERGGEVIAETDAARDTIALAERFGADVIVLDLGLEFGSGDDVLRHFAGQPDAPAIVVFTAFDGEVDSPAASAVVRKPAFVQLERALDRVVRLEIHDEDRRRPTRSMPAPGRRDELGLDDTGEFYELLVEADPDDLLLALSTDGLDPARTAATVRQALRADDRLTLRRGWLVALLVGGGETGLQAVTERLTVSIPDVEERIRSAITGEAPADVFLALTT